MILVDTSAWIEFFRGRGKYASRVDDALESCSAAICGPILTELGRGFGANERRRIMPLIKACPCLEQPEHLWDKAGDLGFFLRSKGVSTKTMDLLIAVYAIEHKIPLLTCDSDFQRIQLAGVELYLVPMESTQRKNSLG